MRTKHDPDPTARDTGGKASRHFMFRTRGPNALRWNLFLASAVGLFVELALIRWIPNTVHVVAFFANLVLIASFLGLGIGMSQPAVRGEAGRDAAMRFAILVAALSLLGRFEPRAIGAGIDFALNEGQGRGIALPLALVLLFCFALVVWALIPFGRLVAKPFDSIERLRAYSINVAGSLTGVVAFALVSWTGAPPLVWFGMVTFALVGLRAGVLTLGLVAVALTVSLTRPFWDSETRSEEVSWSPYYQIRVNNFDPVLGRAGGFMVDVNNQFLLTGMDLSPSYVPSVRVLPDVLASQKALTSYYDFPFLLRSPGRVLVLGSGAGNDVAAAIRAGAKEVVAVEIDPEIMTIAQDHPEHPFASAIVTPVVDDARAYLRTEQSRFDLVLFATLDAHGLLSSLGSVRLDSFIYTLESLEEAKARLNDDGLLVLSFGPFREDIQFRQYEMVRQVFAQEPLYFVHANGHRTIVAGATESLESITLAPVWRSVTAEEIAAGFARYPHARIVATDDWPHLYNRSKVVPREYLAVLAGIALIAILLVRINLRGSHRLQPHFLFLGAGFLLLETKSVTEFALLIGSTWLTNALVFSVILAGILLVNLSVVRGWMRLPVPALFALLGASLVLQFLLPVSTWVGAPGATTTVIAALYLGVPIVLASSIFATTFQRAAVGTAALASNLVGAVLGGFSEYASLAVGLRALSIMALVMYGLAFASWRRSDRSSEPDNLELVESST